MGCCKNLSAHSPPGFHLLSLLVFLSFCSRFLGCGIMTGLQTPMDLSPLSSNVLTILSFLIFLVDCIFFQEREKKVSISIPHIQPQCLGLNEVFPAEFGVFVLPGSNPLPLK